MSLVGLGTRQGIFQPLGRASGERGLHGVRGSVRDRLCRKRKEIKESDMARIGAAYLDTNDMFPKLELQLVSGEK